MTPTDSGAPPPLIVTAAFDAAAAAAFQRLRTTHFPPHLDRVPAHLTLFHHLPGNAAEGVSATLRAVTIAEAIGFSTTGPRPLGRGVAFGVDAPRLVAVRRQLAEGWRGWLTAQDRQPFRPHVTIQNKVDPATARALQAELLTDAVVVSGTIVGLALWRYRGGPWEAAGAFPFGPANGTV